VVSGGGRAAPVDGDRHRLGVLAYPASGKWAPWDHGETLVDGAPYSGLDEAPTDAVVGQLLRHPGVHKYQPVLVAPVDELRLRALGAQDESVMRAVVDDLSVSGLAHDLARERAARHTPNPRPAAASSGRITTAATRYGCSA
jgi:hypothetical protein